MDALTVVNRFQVMKLTIQTMKIMVAILLTLNKKTDILNSTSEVKRITSITVRWRSDIQKERWIST